METVMKKSICLFLLVIVVAAGGPNSGVDAVGECGKFTTERMLTHKLRHCEKAARDVRVTVSEQCCKEMLKTPIPCLYAIIFSDAFKKAGINPEIAYTIPKRCQSQYPPVLH